MSNSPLESLMQAVEGLKDLNIEGSINEAKELAREKLYTSSSGGGVVSVSINGAGEVTDLAIDPSLLEVDSKEELEILLISAFNDAIANVLNGQKEVAASMLGNLNLFGK